MKIYVFAIAALLAQAWQSIAIASRRKSVTFGPESCVTLSRSSAATCVISTDCAGVDISRTEFVFTCVESGNIVRHSFGVGGFDVNEEFDTEVKCDSCEGAIPIEVIRKARNSDEQLVAERQTSEQKEILNAPSATNRRKSKRLISTGAFIKGESRNQQVDRYGPDDCVSTYRNKKGNCILQTNCDPSAVANYEFGLVCVDSWGSRERHLFGTNSFNAQETFDTLIQCDQCLGLDSLDEVGLNAKVSTMSRKISDLSRKMDYVTSDVERLKASVFPANFMAAPTYALTHTTVTRHRQAHVSQPERKFNLRHPQAKHLEYRDDENDEEDVKPEDDDFHNDVDDDSNGRRDNDNGEQFPVEVMNDNSQETEAQSNDDDAEVPVQMMNAVGHDQSNSDEVQPEVPPNENSDFQAAEVDNDSDDSV